MEKYLCPSCQNSVNVSDDVVLVGETKTGMRGIIFLSTELGDYRTEFSEDFSLVEGNVVKYSCPICHASLSTHKNKAQLIRIDEEGNDSIIIFSEILGDHCTYEIKDDELTRSFGEPNEDFSMDEN